MKELSTSQVSTQVADGNSVDAAILSRFSARAFLNKPVEKTVLEDLTQPWRLTMQKNTITTLASGSAPTLTAVVSADLVYTACWALPRVRKKKCTYSSSKISVSLARQWV